MASALQQAVSTIQQNNYKCGMLANPQAVASHRSHFFPVVTITIVGYDYSKKNMPLWGFS